MRILVGEGVQKNLPFCILYVIYENIIAQWRQIETQFMGCGNIQLGAFTHVKMEVKKLLVNISTLMTPSRVITYVLKHPHATFSPFTQ